MPGWVHDSVHIMSTRRPHLAYCARTGTMANFGAALERCVLHKQPTQNAPAVSCVSHLPGQVHQRRPLGPAHLKEQPLLVDASIEARHLLLPEAHLEVALSQEGSLHSSGSQP